MSGTYYDLFEQFAGFLGISFLLLSPMLILGLFLSGLLHLLIPRAAVLKWLRHDNLRSVATSAGIGVPMPLCSCSVVPVVTELRRKGASRSACMSFLITAPETGADSILVTHVFFGPIVALVRPVISFVTAVVAGIFCIGLSTDKNTAQQHLAAAEEGHCDGHASLVPGADDCYLSPAQLKASWLNWFRNMLQRKPVSSMAARPPSLSMPAKPFLEEPLEEPLAQPFSAEPSAEPSAQPIEKSFLVEPLATPRSEPLDFRKIIRHVFHYGFVEVADDILFPMLLGILLGGVLFLLIPDDLMAYDYARWLSYPAMLLVGVPLYICASASTPIAAALVAKGFSPGAALIFLMTGPATNTSTIAIVVNQFGVRFASVYVGSVIAVTVILGIGIDWILIAAGITLAVNLDASHSTVIQFIEYAGALVLGSLMIWRFRARLIAKGSAA